MKFPKHPVDIKNEIQLSIIVSNLSGSLRFRQFIRMLGKVPEEKIIEGVFLVIEDQKSGFDQQRAAGNILSELKPSTNRDIDEFVNRIIKTWDRSCQEIIYWFAFNYGVNQAKSYLEQLKNQQMGKFEKEQIDTMNWW